MIRGACSHRSVDYKEIVGASDDAFEISQAARLLFAWLMVGFPGDRVLHTKFQVARESVVRVHMLILGPIVIPFCFIRATQSLSPRFFFLFQPDKDRLQQPARGAVHTYLLFSDRTPECVVELTFLSPDSASSTANATPRCHISFLSVLMTSLGCLFRYRRYRSTSSETQKLNRISGDLSLVRA